MKTSGQDRAFTLVELLVAAGISAFLASLMVTIIAQAAELSTRSAERLHGEAVARGIFTRIEDDLTAAVRQDGSISAAIVDHVSELAPTIWEEDSHAKPDGPISLRSSGSLAESRFGVGGTWLRLVTTRTAPNADPASVSAPVAVAYRIARRRRLPTDPMVSYMLCRSEVRPAAGSSTGPGTLETGYALTADGYAADAMAVPGDPGTLAVPLVDAADSPVIADGVIDFGLRGYARDPTAINGLRQLLPDPEAGDSLQPEIVDVMLRILTDTGVQRIARFESGQSADVTGEAWWALAVANSHVFIRRIVIVAGNP